LSRQVSKAKHTIKLYFVSSIDSSTTSPIVLVLVGYNNGEKKPSTERNWDGQDTRPPFLKNLSSMAQKTGKILH